MGLDNNSHDEDLEKDWVCIDTLLYTLEQTCIEVNNKLQPDQKKTINDLKDEESVQKRNNIREILRKHIDNVDDTPIDSAYNGITMLWWAAFSMQCDIVQEILGKYPNANINAAPTGGPNEGKTVLWVLAGYEQWSIVRLILNQYFYANVNAVPTEGDDKGVNLLWLAAAGQQWPLVQLILEKHPYVDVNVAPYEGPNKDLNALWFAAVEKQWPIVSLILKQYSDVDVNVAPYKGPNKGLNILWLAAARKQWFLVQLMLEKHPYVDVNVAPIAGDDAGLTVFWLAADGQQNDIAEKILDDFDYLIDITSINKNMAGILLKIEYDANNKNLIKNTDFVYEKIYKTKSKNEPLELITKIIALSNNIILLSDNDLANLKTILQQITIFTPEEQQQVEAEQQAKETLIARIRGIRDNIRSWAWFVSLNIHDHISKIKGMESYASRLPQEMLNAIARAILISNFSCLSSLSDKRLNILAANIVEYAECPDYWQEFEPKQQHIDDMGKFFENKCIDNICAAIARNRRNFLPLKEKIMTGNPSAANSFYSKLQVTVGTVFNEIKKKNNISALYFARTERALIREKISDYFQNNSFLIAIETFSEKVLNSILKDVLQIEPEDKKIPQISQCEEYKQSKNIQEVTRILMDVIISPEHTILDNLLFLFQCNNKGICEKVLHESIEKAFYQIEKELGIKEKKLILNKEQLRIFQQTFVYYYKGSSNKYFKEHRFSSIEIADYIKSAIQYGDFSSSLSQQPPDTNLKNDLQPHK